MEIFFVYSLVFLFLLGFALFSMLVLATDPDREENAPAPAHPSLPTSSVQESLIAYGILAALFLFFMIVTLQSREQCLHFQLDMRK